MTKEEEKLLHTFEFRLRQLIEAYRNLEQQNKQLLEKISQTEGDLEQALADIELQKQKYANLKLAKMIEIHDDELHSAKKKLTKLVRDVEKSIALLDI
jgi:uncharacterized membrane protein YgaE (UPF0421/DUF939 family)